MPTTSCFTLQLRVCDLLPSTHINHQVSVARLVKSSQKFVNLEPLNRLQHPICQQSLEEPMFV